METNTNGYSAVTLGSQSTSTGEIDPAALGLAATHSVDVTDATRSDVAVSEVRVV